MQNSSNNYSNCDDECANLIEVFSSIQGEGLYCGVRQVFVRFASCNLKCEYCDTSKSWVPPRLCTVWQFSRDKNYLNSASWEGARQFHRDRKTSPEVHRGLESSSADLGGGINERHIIKNPVSLESLLEVLDDFLRAPHHSISLTGGEPLVQTPFLEKFLPLARQRRIPIYLETNGTLCLELEKIIDLVDVVAMDVKIPSTSGMDEKWDVHRRFLEIARKKEVFVKAVVSSSTTGGEIEKACDVIRGVSPDIPLVIQPVTLKDGKIGVGGLKLLQFQEKAARALKNVRVIPQVHKLLSLA